MKKITLTILLLTLTITGCQKESNKSDISTTAQQTVAKFNTADKKISQFLDQLERTNTSLRARKQIICKDYPNVYHNEYAPALLQLSSDRSLEQLKQDLKQALGYYTEKYQITC